MYYECTYVCHFSFIELSTEFLPLKSLCSQLSLDFCWHDLGRESRVDAIGGDNKCLNYFPFIRLLHRYYTRHSGLLCKLMPPTNTYIHMYIHRLSGKYPRVLFHEPAACHSFPLGCAVSMLNAHDALHSFYEEVRNNREIEIILYWATFHSKGKVRGSWNP